MPELKHAFKIHIRSKNGEDVQIIESERILLGRSLDADVVFRWKGVSREHASIVQRDGQIYVSDLNSKGGVEVNGVRINPGEEYRYSPGELIRLSDMDEVLRIELVRTDSLQGRHKSTAQSGGAKASFISISQKSSNLLKKIGLVAPKNEKDAGDRAKVIVDKAHGRAESIVEKANWKAENIVLHAKREAEEILQKSRENSQNVAKEARLNAEKLLVEKQRELNQRELMIDKSRREIVMLAESEAERIRQEALDFRQTAMAEAEARLKVEVDEYRVQKLEDVNQEANQMIAAARKRTQQAVFDAEAQAEQILREAETRTAELLKEARQEKTDWVAERDKLRDEIKELESRVERLITGEEREGKKLGQIRDEIETCQEEMNLLREQKNSLLREHESLSSDISDSRMRLQDEEKAFREIQIERETIHQQFMAFKYNLESGKKEYDERMIWIEESEKRIREELEAIQIKTSEIEKKESEIDRQQEEVLKEVDLIRSESLSERDRIISEANAQAECRLKEVEEAEKCMKEEIESLRDRNDRQLQQAREKFERESTSLREESERQIDLALQEANEKARTIVQTAEDETRRRTEENQRILSAKREQTEVLLREAEREKQSLVRATEEEMERRKRDLEQEIVEMRLRQVDEQKAALKQIEDREMKSRQAAVHDITHRLHAKLLTSFDFLRGEDKNLDLRASVEQMVSASVYGEINDERENQDKVKSMLSFDPEQKDQVRRYWKRVGVSMGAVFVCFVLYSVFGGQLRKHFSKAIDSAKAKPSQGELYVQKANEERENLRVFSPDMDEEFKSTYTDNVIYTKGYLDFEQNDDIKDQWILKLNDYMLETLKTKDNAVVDFISLETRLLRELKDLKEKINGARPETGIQKMHETEDGLRGRMIKAAGSGENLKKIYKLKARIYKDYAGLKMRGVSSEELPQESEDRED